MKRITTGDFARAMAAVCPIVTDDMVRCWCEAGKLEHWKNPLNDRGWIYINPAKIPDFLHQSKMISPKEIGQVLEQLKLKPVQALLR